MAKDISRVMLGKKRCPLPIQGSSMKKLKTRWQLCGRRGIVMGLYLHSHLYVGKKQPLAVCVCGHACVCVRVGEGLERT